MTTIETLPLNKLVYSKDNVRRTGGEDGIAELAASIAVHGLRQNLNVRATDKGRFEVIAGGRRLRALKQLVKEGLLAKDVGVPCRIMADGENAAEISLVENTMRLAMLGSVLQLSCWVLTAVTVLGDIHWAYRRRQADVRVKRSRSEARTTLDAAATPQACP